MIDLAGRSALYLDPSGPFELLVNKHLLIRNASCVEIDSRSCCKYPIRGKRLRKSSEVFRSFVVTATSLRLTEDIASAVFLSDAHGCKPHWFLEVATSRRQRSVSSQFTSLVPLCALAGQHQPYRVPHDPEHSLNPVVDHWMLSWVA